MDHSHRQESPEHWKVTAAALSIAQAFGRIKSRAIGAREYGASSISLSKVKIDCHSAGWLPGGI
jgi:hypothetical protein